MASQAPTPVLHLFKEGPIDCQNPTGSVIRIEANTPSSFAVRRRQTRSILRAQHAYDSADIFSQHHSATDSSIFHSSSSRFPRNFLWRVIQDQKILEVRSVDLNKDAGEAEDPIYTIQLQFNGQLKTGGIALADGENFKSLYVFVLTKSSELYTIELPKSFFTRRGASEIDVSRWIAITQPATFSISVPKSLVAVSSSHLLVSLCDGRLLQLSRKGANSGSWTESSYGDGSWSTSLRGLVKWQGNNTVVSDGTTLEQGAALSIAVSPDNDHVLGICLNHQLRIWSVSKGTVIFSKDLLNQRREHQDPHKYMIGPRQNTYLQILRLSGLPGGFQYCALAFSPHDAGEFKFWAVRDADAENGVQDAFPDRKFVPPDPDPSPQTTSYWTVADFKVFAAQEAQEVRIWLLMRQKHQYKIYNLQCDFQSLASKWGDAWTCVTTYDHDEGLAPRLNSQTLSDAGTWVDRILQSPSCPDFVLESALLIYLASNQFKPDSPQLPFKSRMLSAVERKINLTTNQEEDDSMRLRTFQEFSTFWSYLQDLQRSRLNAIGLSLDESTGLPWIVASGSCSVVRSSTRLETMSDNDGSVLAVSHDRIEMPSVETEVGGEPKLPNELAVLISAARSLRSTFSPELQHLFEVTLEEWLTKGSKATSQPNLEEYAQQCNFEREFGDELLEDLDRNLEPLEGLQNIDTDAFFAITDSFSAILSDTPSDLDYTNCGLRTLTGAAREMIYRREGILLDLLACTIVATTEVDQSESAMPYFDGPQIFERLLELIKQYRVLRWLVDHTYTGEGSPSQPHNESSIDWKPTLLEKIFATDLKPQSAESQSHSEAFTHSIEDLLQWTMGGKDALPLDEVTVHIQCHLIRDNKPSLATSFLPFQPSHPWSTYVKGRLSLLKSATTDASTHFQSAAAKLSKPANLNKFALKDLLSPSEAAHFGQGLPAYYSHIINLFTSTSPPCSKEAAHFATLALEKLPKSDVSDQHTSLLTSLFTASLQTQDFNTAHSALIRHPEPTTLLPALITSLLATPHAAQNLLTFSWPPNLHRHIDTILSENATPKQLAAFRVHLNNFQGAAAALLPPLLALQAKAKKSLVREKLLETEYLTVINLLECAGEENAWVFSREKGRRKVVTLPEIRGMWQAELDRRDMVQGGKWAFKDVGNGEGDDDVVMDLL